MLKSTSVDAVLEELGFSLDDEILGGHVYAALTRRAWNIEHGLDTARDHESLELLGDRVLGGLVAHELWRRFPGAEPGRLDLARDALTSAGALADVARKLGLLSAIRMGAGERLQGQVEGDKALSDHVEALIGAVFLIEGWSGAGTLVMALLSDQIPRELPEKTERLDGEHGGQAMTALSGLVQQRFKVNLAKSDWDVQRVGGTDNAPMHQATVTLPDGSRHEGDIMLGSKDGAKASAAQAALSYLRES